MKNKRINLFFKIDRETTREDENMIIWLLIEQKMNILQII